VARSEGLTGCTVALLTPIVVARKLNAETWRTTTRRLHAVYENGVFQPIGPVDPPDSCEVELEPRVIDSGSREGALDEVYTVLSERYTSGERDVAARHDEHQP